MRIVKSFSYTNFFWVLAVNESKAVDTIVPKSDHPTLFQKVKKAFEFPKSHKSKESPAKEVPAKEPEADVEPAPVAEAESAALASSVAAEPEVMPLAAATPEAKPTVSEKASEKVSEGKGFFNKVKKSFFTKSYSFSGSIPDSKLGVAPAAPPPAIAEVRKQADTVSAVEDTEVRVMVLQYVPPYYSFLYFYRTRIVSMFYNFIKI
jgi:hypothetical protein